MMTPAKVQQLLESSDLPRRLETARSQPEYRDAMHVEPKRPPMIAMIAILALLGGAAALPLVGIAVMPTRPPFGVYVFLAVLSAMFVALTVATARRFVTLRHAPVRRELYAVIDRDHLMIDTTNIYYLTLWSPGTPPFRAQLMRGKPSCGVGDVGVALFRGKHLVDIIKVPVASKSAAG